jgi:hypothetical protein
MMACLLLLKIHNIKKILLRVSHVFAWNDLLLKENFMMDVSNISDNQKDKFNVLESERESQKSQIIKKEQEVGKEIGSAENEQIAKEELEKLDKILTTVMTQPSLNTNILNRIIRLLTDLLPLLQNLATAQANQLDLPTKMQTLYTELIAKAPIYTKENVPKGGDVTQMNNNVALWTDRLRSYRDVWSDTAKKTQSNINITQEAVSQQVDMLTTFLQQLRELCSLITR